MPVEIEVNISSFVEKESINLAIDVLRNKLEREDIANKPIFDQLLKGVSNFVEYKQLRNYDLGNLKLLLKEFNRVVEADKGVFTLDNIKRIYDIQDQIKDETVHDSISRAFSSGLRPPNHYKQVYDVTSKKNNEFVAKFKEVIDKANIAEESTTPSNSKRFDKDNR